MLRVLIKRMMFFRRFSDDSCPSEMNKWSELKNSLTCKNEPKQVALVETEVHETKPSDIPPTKDLLPIEKYTEYYAKNSVAIIKPVAKVVTQQGTSCLGSWEIKFDTKQRWENPTIGWCSSGDVFSNVSLTFPDKESAVDFVQKRGWHFYVDEAEKEKKLKKFKPKSYSENFSYNRRTRVSTK